MSLSSHKTFAETHTKISSAAGVLQIPPNPNRCALIVNSPLGKNTFLQLGAADPTNQGVLLSNNGTPSIFTESDLGNVVREAFTLVDSAGVQVTYSWIDVQYAP